MKELTSREKLVLELRSLVPPTTFNSIGERIGVTGSRARQIWCDGLRKQRAIDSEQYSQPNEARWLWGERGWWR